MKKFIIILVVVLLAVGVYFCATGLNENPNVVLLSYEVSEDDSKITFQAGVATSIGYIRGFKDEGGGVKPHYLTFYATFGGINSSFGAKNTFELNLAPDDREIYFNRADGGYELVLYKDDITGMWQRPIK